MKKTVTKKITGLLVLLFAFISFASLAQTEKTKQQKQDEQGAALKKWFDEGEIIVDAVIEDGKTVENSYPNSGDGYVCLKVKVTRVLKNKLNVGYVNLKIDFAEITNYENVKFIQYMSGVYNIIQLNHRYLIKIKKTDISQEGYIIENKGVYEKDGDAKEITTNEAETYQQLHNYCGVKTDGLEKKSLNPTQQQINKALYEQKIKNRREITQFVQAKLQQRNQSPNSTSSTTQCSDLLISEVLDGNGSDNAVEVYNTTSLPISLSNYKLLIYHNASLTPTTIALTGTISAYGTHVVAQQGASSAILAHANQTTSNLNFNGDVVTALNKGNTHIDIIGEIGVANAAGNWTLTPSGGTNNSDIRRKYSIGAGDTTWSVAKSEFNVFPMDSVSNLGHHQSHCGIDPDLNVGLANAYSVDSSNGKSYVEFDIVVNSAGTASIYLDYTEIDLTYDTAALGPDVVANNKITVVRGALFNTNTYAAPQASLLGGIDTISMIFSSNHSNGSWNRVAITASTVQLVRVFIEVGNRCNHNANVQFFNTSFTSFFSFFDNSAGDDPNISANSIGYDNVYYTIGNPLNYTKPCAGIPNITGIVGGYLSAPNSVIAGAYYNTITYNESQLTINGNGFGSSQPTVLMTNAVAGISSNPTYIKLDSMDITSWNDNQIILNVPSIMLNGNQIYPGTGYIKVVKFSTTDTASSQVLGSNGMVQIPYALYNRSNGIHKYRIGFAYRAMTDSAGNADTSAYNFRFDANTVNPSVTSPYTRQLLKTAIHDWACNLTIRYRIGKDTTINNPNPDGISYITFKPTLSNPTFVAETGIAATQCISSLNFFAKEADVSFKSGVSWYYANPSHIPIDNPDTLPTNGSVDLFSVALHEFGHVSLLLHVNQTNDLMYYSVPLSGPIGPYISTEDYSGGVDNLFYSKTLDFSSCPAAGAITLPATSSGACADPSNGITAIETIGNSTFEISVYPNPAGDYLNVTFVKDKESSNTVKLTNTLGQTVFYSNIGKNEGANEVINTSQLAKGMYILTVTDNANTVTKKIIVE